jgi:hypothetical protein
MPKTDQATNPTRRTILGRIPAAALASSAVLSTAAFAADRDSVIFDLVAKVKASENKIKEIAHRMAPVEKAFYADRSNKLARSARDLIQAEIDRATDENVVLLDRLAATRPITLAGLKAKAEIAIWDDEVATALAPDLIAFGKEA